MSQPQAPPTKHRSLAKTLAIVIVGVVVIIVVVAVIMYIVLPMAGVNVTTGALKVRYNSVWGNDIEIFIDGESQGIHPSDQFVTFNGISPGMHTVEARDTSGTVLDSQRVEVTAGETIVVELSY